MRKRKRVAFYGLSRQSWGIVHVISLPFIIQPTSFSNACVSCPAGHSAVRVSSCDLMRSISLSMAGMAFTVKDSYTPIKAQGPVSQV